VLGLQLSISVVDEIKMVRAYLDHRRGLTQCAAQVQAGDNSQNRHAGEDLLPGSSAARVNSLDTARFTSTYLVDGAENSQ